MNKKVKSPHRSSLQFNTLPRRRFLKQSALASAALALGTAPSDAITALRKVPKALSQPNKSGIEHIIVVMMENRSFDQFELNMEQRRQQETRQQWKGLRRGWCCWRRKLSQRIVSASA